MLNNIILGICLTFQLSPQVQAKAAPVVMISDSVILAKLSKLEKKADSLIQSKNKEVKNGSRRRKNQ